MNNLGLATSIGRVQKRHSRQQGRLAIVSGGRDISFWRRKIKLSTGIPARYFCSKVHGRPHQCKNGRARCGGEVAEKGLFRPCRLVGFRAAAAIFPPADTPPSANILRAGTTIGLFSHSRGVENGQPLARGGQRQIEREKTNHRVLNKTESACPPGRFLFCDGVARRPTGARDDVRGSRIVSKETVCQRAK